MDSADVIIIGAGITGLAAAHALRKAGKAPLVLEASDRPGGRIQLVSYDGDSAEAGGQGIHTNYSEMLKLLDEYDLRSALIPTPEKALYLDKKGRPRTSRVKEAIALLVGLRGTADMLAFRSKYFSMAKPNPQFEIAVDIPEYDDMLASEAFESYSMAFQDYVLRPMTHAMGNCTPETTNLYYVVNGLRLALTTDISSLAGGNVRIADAIAARNDVRYGARVETLLVTDGRVDGVQLEGGETVKAKHVIVTTPAGVAGRMVPAEFRPAKEFLTGFPYISLPLVFFFLDRPIASPATRFFGHPFRDAPFNMAVNHARKTPHLVPSGNAIISAWPTYPHTLDLMKRSDDEIIEAALSDMEAFVPGMRDWIRHATVVRHDWAIARYSQGSVKDILNFKEYAKGLKGVSFAGTDYDFIHMEAGILSAYRAVERSLHDIG